MNWYKLLKLAEFLEYDDDESTFLDHLKTIYELEYKTYILSNYPFKGLEQRKENIIKRLTKRLNNSIEKVKPPLLYTFEKWLQGHALTNADAWASARINREEVEALGVESALLNTIIEYSRYKDGEVVYSNRPPNYNKIFSEMIREALENESHFPSLTALKNTLIKERQNELDISYESEGKDEFGENMIGQPFNSDEEAQQYIQNEINNFDLSEYMYNYEITYENIENIFNNMGIDITKFIFELNKNLIFPLWFEYWEERGIIETRKRVENAYKMLSNASNVNSNIVAINHALNTTHQTGDMVDYFEDEENGISGYEIKKLLSALSSNQYLKEWNNDLRKIGLKMVTQVQQMASPKKEEEKYELV
ncbi:MAG: hypothetical protein WC942_06035 [Clostridia bacterium]|jgi:hypothetical protein